MTKYQKAVLQSSPSATIAGTLQEMILQHLGEWIPRLVEEEIEEYLGRKPYAQHQEGEPRQYRNGYHKERSLTTGMGTVGLRLQRLREPFESQIVQRYQRTTAEVQALLDRGYPPGLPTMSAIGRASCRERVY